MLAVIVFALILISHFLWRWCYYSCCTGTPAAWVQRKLCAAAEVMDKFLFLCSLSTSAGVMDLQYFLCWRVAPLFLLSKPFCCTHHTNDFVVSGGGGKKKRSSKEGKQSIAVLFCPFFFVRVEMAAQFLVSPHTKKDQNNLKTSRCYAKLPLALMTALALFTFPPSFAFQVKTHD